MKIKPIVLSEILLRNKQTKPKTSLLVGVIIVIAVPAHPASKHYPFTDSLLEVSLFFSLLNQSHRVTAATLTVMIRLRIAHKTSALTAHLSFIRGWPKPARKYRGMKFPWPPGMLSHSMHKSQSVLQR